MPPKKAKPTTAIDASPAPSQAHTPEQSPAKSAAVAGITQAQKQMLIDNLQQEITKRARMLRGQYAVQAQQLRSRLEMRINRIPPNIRKKKMQDLLEEHVPKPLAPLQEVGKEGPQRKSLKRTSDQISTASPNPETEGIDKENANPSQSQELANPKKRAKTTNATSGQQANTKATRTTSRKGAPPATSVLSPKSHNSRTLPKSPFKPAAASPEKPTFVRPTSPAKAAPPVKRGVRAASRQQGTNAAGRKNTRAAGGGAGSETEGRDSEASTTSAGTTVVTKGAGDGKRKPAMGGKKGASTAAKGMAAVKKAVGAGANKKENVPPASTAGGGRSLRKRG